MEHCHPALADHRQRLLFAAGFQPDLSDDGVHVVRNLPDAPAVFVSVDVCRLVGQG
jgi:hypothetical protein